ncbi:hypothetical protein CPT_Sansa14 [Caulobacter phage Sansa]|uniref:Uncharacterized protein n=1 Tax=Caulobacter phage Sansa TaxID=1675600 RepID=A0A0K1LMK7_9CAUD|nr:hypothetical protein HOR07_gp014 [Caulobacter phage Sansa]AKU43418.1 hypothetical protein CPT_Sansa14 [Caulobacter phage Sansa]
MTSFNAVLEEVWASLLSGTLTHVVVLHGGESNVLIDAIKAKISAEQVNVTLNLNDKVVTFVNGEKLRIIAGDASEKLRGLMLDGLWLLNLDALPVDVWRTARDRGVMALRLGRMARFESSFD